MVSEQEMLVALGSNLSSARGGPVAVLGAAIAAMAQAGLRVRRVSRFYATPCFPAGAGPDYVNACAALAAPGPPRDMLGILHEIEAEFGRDRVQRWASRTLDLDILAMGECVLPDAATQTRWREIDLASQGREAPAELILPHPRIQDRAFVLVPLADIAPDWRHPLLHVTVAQMAAALADADRRAVTAI